MGSNFELCLIPPTPQYHEFAPRRRKNALNQTIHTLYIRNSAASKGIICLFDLLEHDRESRSSCPVRPLQEDVDNVFLHVQIAKRSVSLCWLPRLRFKYPWYFTRFLQIHTCFINCFQGFRLVPYAAIDA